MVANQSRHTMHLSDMAWDEGTPQLPLGWQVGQYYKKYMERYLTPDDRFELRLSTRVVSAEPRGDVWDVVSRSPEDEEVKAEFDRVIVASGFFGKPVFPPALSPSSSSPIPIIHSSAYRDLESLLPNPTASGGKILVVGGQMSGVEIAGTIASHLSSAMYSPTPTPNNDKYTVHNVVQRPIWVFPLYTSPEAGSSAAPFLPLDFASYNLNNRQHPLENTQGHITEESAQATHGIFQAVLGTDQGVFSNLLKFSDEDKKEQPYLAASDWYCDFVRSGLITLSSGKVDALDGTTASLTTGEKIDNIAAVVVATGFDPSPSISYLPESVLSKLNHSPKHPEQSVALAFHGTHHPDVPGLGFVGFYRSPYLGVMEMQARFLAKYWDSTPCSKLEQKLAEDISIQRTLSLRDDPRLSQFPMGDYPYIMQEMAEALSLDMTKPKVEGLPVLGHNNQPLDMLTPSRYPLPGNTEADGILQDTHDVALSALATPRFVPRAVFRSLLGKWRLERDLVSKLPSHPSGHFSGTAHFHLRSKTSDGLRCAAEETSTTTAADEQGLEYLYVEEGEFQTSTGFGFKATRRYVWRYDDDREVLSVWFTKPEDQARADYLFHEVEFEQPPDRRNGWDAKAGHLCIDDFYDVKYNFRFEAVNLETWTVGYTVKGPKKDYTIHGCYRRE
ncbi:hypothetical protein N3K66_000277 [Trichothecium roseum]|uniref:Uncharacterized protein n=1 Tax=Trichothecium roseum TaxID=47278 RepID=A0ACC0VC92_9HYPO|nr:hypothetical protein N3K66_000277 [Trichothecium roseum]